MACLGARSARPYCRGASRDGSPPDPRPFFRPPNGGYDADVLAAVGASGYRYTVTWDIDTIDWRPPNRPPSRSLSTSRLVPVELARRLVDDAARLQPGLARWAVGQRLGPAVCPD